MPGAPTGPPDHAFVVPATALRSPPIAGSLPVFALWWLSLRHRLDYGGVARGSPGGSLSPISLEISGGAPSSSAPIAVPRKRTRRRRRKDRSAPPRKYLPPPGSESDPTNSRSG